MARFCLIRSSLESSPWQHSTARRWRCWLARFSCSCCSCSTIRRPRNRSTAHGARITARNSSTWRLGSRGHIAACKAIPFYASCRRPMSRECHGKASCSHEGAGFYFFIAPRKSSISQSSVSPPCRPANAIVLASGDQAMSMWFTFKPVWTSSLFPVSRCNFQMRSLLV